MYKLIEFIRSIYVALLFIVLEIVAVNYYARSTSYTQARLLARSNQVVGGVHGVFAGIRHYFSLGHENELLTERVAELEGRLAAYAGASPVIVPLSGAADSLLSKYRTMTARMVSNTTNRMQNFIVLDKGALDGVVEQMAVLTPGGAMLGYVVDCSAHYAVAVSALNTSFRASGRLVGSDYFGSIYWDGLDQHEVVMDEVSKYADPQPGQEVVSTGFSLYFPADVRIGQVVSAELNETRTAYRVRVRLAAEISRVNNVILVENRDLNETQSLLDGDKVNQFIRQ